MFVKKNYLDAAQEIKFKRIIICLIEEVNELKEDTDSSMKLRKIPDRFHEHTNVSLMKMMKTILDLKTKFNKEIEILKRTHAKKKCN